MRVLLRADANPDRGTGHVMRCLTLAESLLARGHEVCLMGAITSVPWLERRLTKIDIELIECQPDSLELRPLKSYSADWLVVDSYWITADDVSRANTEVPSLAIVDGDDRGINASLYLDQNLGSELLPWREHVGSRMLSGSTYALVRDGVLKQRRESADLIRHTPPRVLAFMGGSDPYAAIMPVVGALIAADLGIELTAICPVPILASLAEVADSHGWIDLIAPTNDLPRLMGEADVVVSACGTSAWELCTLGIPSLLIAVADNQLRALANVRTAGVALGVDAVTSTAHHSREIGQSVSRLITEPSLRQALTARCGELFDGAGKVRVVEAMEQRRS